MNTRLKVGEESMIPTFEEYAKEVKSIIQEDFGPYKDAEELREYLASDEVNDEIRKRYPKSVRDYKNGRFLPTAWGDAAASVAYCLELMF